MKRFLVQVFGWRNWAVFVYNSFIEHIFVAFYILLMEGEYSNLYLGRLIAFYGFSILSTSFGYLLNDLADRELDALHGKPNTFENDSPFRAVAIVSVVFLGSVVFALPFWSQSAFLALWGSWIFLTVAYSAPPFRLKERGPIGLVAVVLAQRVLPILLLFAAFRFSDWSDLILLTVYVLVRGIASDLNHQLEDYVRDARTGTQTFVVKSGVEKTRKLFYQALNLERIFQVLIVFRICFRLQTRFPEITLPLVLFVLLFLTLEIYSFLEWRKGKDPNPFIPDKKNIFQFLHHPFQNIVVPFLLLLLLIRENFAFLFVLVLLALNKGLFRKETIVQSFPYQFLQKNILR